MCMLIYQERLIKKGSKYIKYTKAKRLLEEILSNRAGSAPNKSNQELPNLIIVLIHFLNLI